jgi:hypothetical protein
LQRIEIEKRKGKIIRKWKKSGEPIRPKTRSSLSTKPATILSLLFFFSPTLYFSYWDELLLAISAQPTEASIEASSFSSRTRARMSASTYSRSCSSHANSSSPNMEKVQNKS